MSFTRTATSSCYVIHTGKAGSCSCATDGVAVCKPDASAMRSVRFDTPAVQLQSNVTSMVFDPIQGTVTPTATLRFNGKEKHAVNLVVNIMGRVRSCTPTAGVSGYKPC